MLKDLKTVIFLLILSSISVALLSIGNNLYLEASKKASSKLFSKILLEYDIPFTQDDVVEVFFNNFQEYKLEKEDIVYVSKIIDKGSSVIKTQGPGLWSVLELLIFVSSKGDNLNGLIVLAQAETPGLGARIEEEEFLNQFQGVSIRPILEVVKKATKKNQVDGISGATMTSNAVQAIINSAIVLKDNIEIGGDDSE